MTERDEIDERLERLGRATEPIRAPADLADRVMAALVQPPARGFAALLSRSAPAALIAGAIAAAASVLLASSAQRTVDEGAIAGVAIPDSAALAGSE